MARTPAPPPLPLFGDASGAPEPGRRRRQVRPESRTKTVKRIPAASEYEIAVESAAPTIPKRGIRIRFDVALTASATAAATMFTCWRFRLVKLRDRIWYSEIMMMPGSIMNIGGIAGA
jgi:hypothetical protein